MEGLLLAAVLDRLQARLPAGHLGWRFADAATLVLPLAPPTAGALWLELRPPAPRLTLAADAGDARAAPFTPFQAQLRARTQGPLEAADQAALDRRCTLRFAAGEGFVPSPPVWLEVELTGRHANAVLRDGSGRILGVLREIGADVNRHRQLRPGLMYRPPPPYAKLDPRVAHAAEIEAALVGRPLAGAHARVDGIGRELGRAWTRLAGIDADAPLTGSALARAQAALARLVADPSGALVEAGADMILVPSCTDLPAGQTRVRQSCRARAIEGQCLVVQAPLVGAVAGCDIVDVSTGRAGHPTPPPGKPPAR